MYMSKYEYTNRSQLYLPKKYCCGSFMYTYNYMHVQYIHMYRYMYMYIHLISVSWILGKWL